MLSNSASPIHDTEVLDRSYELIAGKNGMAGMSLLIDGLRSIRENRTRDQWDGFVQSARRHPVIDLVHLCPMTKRSFDKPRGYAGDAVMLDHIYGVGNAGAFHPASLAGQVYFYTINAPAPRAVRYRRSLIATLIDEAAASSPAPARILSIAAGHLREVELSQSIASRSLATMTALDQDAASLSLVQSSYSELGIETVQGTVSDLIRGRITFKEYDLVYAAGLFDYLARPIAMRLLGIMLDATRPGGKVMIANFLPNIDSVGYMEAYMDWYLIFRTENQLLELFDMSRKKIASLETIADPDGNIAFAVAQRS